MVDNSYAKVFLRNKLTKLKENLSSVSSDIHGAMKIIDGLKTLHEAYTLNPQNGDPDEIQENIITQMRDVTILKLYQVRCQVQMDAISRTIGGEK